MTIKNGIVCVILALIMIPTTISALNNWDNSEEEYKSGCDPTYRVYMGISTDVSPEECDILKDEEVLNLQLFLLSLFIFLISSLVGLILILPNSTDHPPGLV
jgi:hypothetical protein